MRVLIILHAPPYDSEYAYEALRLAGALLQVEKDLELTVYLTAAGVLCAKRGQATPQGFYNIERMLTPILRNGMVMACRTCLEVRGITKDELIEGVIEARLGDLAQLTLESDQVLTY
jgi:uncharacterized protein involved in oxidation of intracellular sulfur